MQRSWTIYLDAGDPPVMDSEPGRAAERRFDQAWRAFSHELRLLAQSEPDMRGRIGQIQVIHSDRFLIAELDDQAARRLGDLDSVMTVEELTLASPLSDAPQRYPKRPRAAADLPPPPADPGPPPTPQMLASEAFGMTAEAGTGTGTGTGTGDESRIPPGRWLMLRLTVDSDLPTARRQAAAHQAFTRFRDELAQRAEAKGLAGQLGPVTRMGRGPWVQLRAGPDLARELEEMESVAEITRKFDPDPPRAAAKAPPRSTSPGL